MNIFINKSPYTIGEIKNGNSYYFDNSAKVMTANLPNVNSKIKISLFTMYETNRVYIYTSKGIYILDNKVRELTLIWDGYWMSPDSTNIIPYYNNSYKQQITNNSYNYARLGENVIITNNRGTTQSDGKYKMSNFVFVSSSNYASRNNSTINGVGQIIVFRQTENGTFFDTTISSTFEYDDGENQGNFGKHMKLLDMGLYDLLLVSAPTKVQPENPYSKGYIYIYSNKLNGLNSNYFHFETKIPFPIVSEIKDLSGTFVDNFTFLDTLFQMESISNVGFSLLFDNKHLYLYSLEFTNGLLQYTTLINSTTLPNYQKCYSNSQQLYLSNNQQVATLNYVTQQWTDLPTPIIQNTYEVNYFGKMLFQYDQGIIIVSEKDFFDFDSNYQLKKRITFVDSIVSSDCYIDGLKRKYIILTSGTQNNVFIFNQDYELLLNKLYKQYSDDFPSLVRFDNQGETVFIATTNNNNLDFNTTQMGNLNNYDLFFEDNLKNIPSLFPDFDIYNQALIEEKSVYPGSKKYYYLEENFENILPLVSNTSNPSKSIENIYPVFNDQGILMELNDENVDDESFLGKYAKYFIYSIPTISSNDYSYILNSSNLYLGWIDTQMIQYNTTAEYLIYTYKTSQNTINVVMLSVGNQPGSLYGKRWNIIESSMDTNKDKLVYDISLNMFGSLVLSEFEKFEKFTFGNELLFIVRNKHSIVVVDYFSRTTVVKTFTREISNDLFYLDDYKNLFHLYKINSDIYLSIHRNGNNYNTYILNQQKMDLTSMPSQIFGQYYANVFVFLEHYNTENNSTIQLRRFDIKQNVFHQIEFEEINISNEFPKNKFILDVDFDTNSISKVYIADFSERNTKIFQKTSEKYFSIPSLFKTKYQSYTKNYTRQLRVQENNFVNYDQYNIEDIVPNVFYNINYQKYFNNKLGVYSDYKFVDIKDIIDFDVSRNVVVGRQNERSFSKYVIYPEPGYEISTFVLDSSMGYLAISEKGLTGGRSNIKIYNINKDKYNLEEKGKVSGVLIQNLHLEKEICYETLDINETTHEFYISEEYDVCQNRIGYWVFNPLNEFNPVRNSIYTPTISRGCFYRTRTDDFISDTLYNNQIPYYININNTYSLNFISLPNHMQITLPYDIKILSDKFFSLNDKDNNYLFVRNASTELWSYFGKQIHKINSPESSYKFNKKYYLDLDISMNDASTLTDTNINIQSTIFGDNKKNFYCIQDNKIFKIEHAILSQLYYYTTISNDGSTIYSQDISGNQKKLFYFEHANQSVLSENTNSPTFCPSIYASGFHQEILSKGYFTLTTSQLGYSKKYLFQPSVSNLLQSSTFPLVDYKYSTYIYQNRILNKYDLSSNTYTLNKDISGSITKITLPIDSSDNIITDMKFESLSYNELQYVNSTINFNKFYDESPVFCTIAPDSSEFIVFEANNFMFFKEDMNNYPNKFYHYKTVVPNNQIKFKIDDYDIPSSFVGDWINNRLLLSYGGMGATGTNRAKIDILSWNRVTHDILHHSDISGGNSFGNKILLSEDSRKLFVSEPKAPASGDYKQGKIHIYQYDNLLNKYTLLKTIRSKLSNIGQNFHISKSLNKMVTYSNENDSNKQLIIFSDLFATEPKEINLDIETIDAVFIGDTDDILVQEKFKFVKQTVQGSLTYSKQTPERKFYIIQDINGCNNIITKYRLTNPILDNNQNEFKMTAFGLNFILFEGLNVCHIMKVQNYKLYYMASQNKPDNSVVQINPLGNTILNMIKNNGSLIISLGW